MKVHEVSLSLFLVAAAGTCTAQTAGARSASATAAQPTTSTQDTSNGTGEKKTPKKVWTNDEIASLHGSVSVVGDARSSPVGQEQKAPEEAAKHANDEARNTQIEIYRSHLQELRSQIEDIDQRAAQLKSFRAENSQPSAGLHLNHRYNMDPLEDQLKQLDVRKKQLQSKIGDIEGQARKNGIDPGDLR